MLSIRPKLRLTKEVCNRHCVTGVTGTLTQPSCLGSMTVLVFSFLSPILTIQSSCTGAGQSSGLEAGQHRDLVGDFTN